VDYVDVMVLLNFSEIVISIMVECHVCPLNTDTTGYPEGKYVSQLKYC